MTRIAQRGVSMSTGEDKRRVLRGWIVAAGLSTLCLWPMHNRQVEGIDEGNYLHISDRILAGQVPYRDFACTEAPGHFYLFAAVQRLCGRHLYPTRVVALILAALMAVLLGETVRHRMGAIRSGLAGAFGAVGAHHFLMHLGYYWTSTLIGYGGLVMILRAAEGAPRRRLVLAGALGTTAFMVKQSCGAYASIGLFVATLLVPAADGADVVRRLSRLMLGVGAALLLWYAAFRLAGMPWGLFWECMLRPFFLIEPSSLGTHFSFPGPSACLPHHLTAHDLYFAAVGCTYYLPLVVLGAMILWEAIGWRRHRPPDRRLLAVCVFASLLMLILWPWYYRRYLSFCLPLPLTLFFALALEWPAGATRLRRGLCLAAIAMMSAYFGYEEQYRYRQNDCDATGRLAGILVTREESRYFARVTEALRSHLRTLFP